MSTTSENTKLSKYHQSDLTYKFYMQHKKANDQKPGLRMQLETVPCISCGEQHHIHCGFDSSQQYNTNL